MRQSLQLETNQGCCAVSVMGRTYYSRSPMITVYQVFRGSKDKGVERRLTGAHACPPNRIPEVRPILRCLRIIRIFSRRTDEALGRIQSKVSGGQGHGQQTFLMMMKLVPIRSEPDTASVRPMYLSCTICQPQAVTDRVRCHTRVWGEMLARR